MMKERENSKVSLKATFDELRESVFIWREFEDGECFSRARSRLVIRPQLLAWVIHQHVLF